MSDCPTVSQPAATKRPRRAVGPVAAPAGGADDGFTLIELLVVIIIIGILASVAIPIFLNQRKKAVDASMKSDLRTVANQMETYYVDNLAYPGVTAAGNVATVGGTAVTLSTGNTVATVAAASAAKAAYCIQITRIAGAQSASQSAWVYESDHGGLQPAGTTSCATAGYATSLP